MFIAPPFSLVDLSVRVRMHSKLHGDRGGSRFQELSDLGNTITADSRHGAGNAQSGNRQSVLQDGDADAAPALHALLIVEGVPACSRHGEFFTESYRVGNSVRCEAGPLGEHSPAFQGQPGQYRFSDRGDVQWIANPQRTGNAECVHAFHSFKVENGIPAHLAEVDGLTQTVTELEHDGTGDVANGLVLPDGASQFEEFQTERIFARGSSLQVAPCQQVFQ